MTTSGIHAVVRNRERMNLTGTPDMKISGIRVVNPDPGRPAELLPAAVTTRMTRLSFHSEFDKKFQIILLTDQK
jgi:hypothetical protein